MSIFPSARLLCTGTRLLTVELFSFFRAMLRISTGTAYAIMRCLACMCVCHVRELCQN